MALHILFTDEGNFLLTANVNSKDCMQWEDNYPDNSVINTFIIVLYFLRDC